MRKCDESIINRAGFVLLVAVSTIALGVLAAVIVGDHSHAAWGGWNGVVSYDPSYAYLFNSISLTNGIAPIFFGHPGLPVIYLGALFAPLAQLLPEAGGQNVNQLSIEHPEFLTGVIQYGLLITNLTLLIVAVMLYRARQGKFAPALLLQTMWLLFMPEYFRVMYMNGESLAIGVSTLALAVVASQENNPPLANKADGLGSNFPNRIDPWLVGTLVAIAVLCKITFAPLALILFCFKGASQIRKAFFALAVVSLLLIIPIMSKLPALYNWLFVLATHRGIYGSGESGFVDWSSIPNNAIDLMFGFPVAALVFILSTLLLTAMVTIKVVSTRSVGLAIRDLRTPIIIYIASLVQLAMVMKHYSAHYAIPGALLIGSCFIVLIGHLEQAGWSARRIGALAWAAIFCAGVLWLTREIPEAIAVDSNERSAVGSLREQFERALDGVDEPLLITTYGSRGEEAAISFGLSYAALDLGKLLNAGDRASLYYNASNGKFRDSSAGWLTRERIYEKMRSGVSVFYFGPVDAGPPGFEEKLLTRENALNQELLLLQPPPATTGGQVELP